MCITFLNPSEPCCERANQLLGRITRWMRPTLVDDYYGFSTHSWSTGETGNRGNLLPGDVASVNRVCFFHELIHENVMSELPETHILSPIRWTMAAPDQDGSGYDFWQALEDLPGLFEHGSPHGFSSNPVSPWLLPADGHCRFVDSKIEYDRFILPAAEIADSTGNNDYNFIFRDSGFQAISPGVSVLPSLPPSFTPSRPLNPFYAIQQVINGTPAGPCFKWADATDQERADFVFALKVKPGDRFEIDIWWQMQIVVQFTRLNEDGSPDEVGDGIIRDLLKDRSHKILNFFPVSLVSTGRLFGTFHHFKNVNFSTRFDAASHRLEFSVAGHVGWTLDGNGNGPLRFSQVATDQADHVIPGHEWISSLQLFWDREIADLYLVPGPAMLARHPELAANQILYRPRWGGDEHYRRRTTHTEFGAITHAPCGRYHQHSITSFELVRWTAGPGPSRERAVGSSIGNDPVFDGLPRRILIKRVTR